MRETRPAPGTRPSGRGRSGAESEGACRRRPPSRLPRVAPLWPRRLLRSSSGPVRLAQETEEFAVQDLVAARDGARRERVDAAVDVGDIAAGLAHEQDSGRQIPGVERAFPVDVGAAAGHVGEVEGGGAEAAYGRDGRHHDRDLAQELGMVAAADVRHAAGDERVGEVAPCRDADAAVVEEGALALLANEHLVLDRVVDDAGDHLALALEPDRDAEL